MDSKGTLSRYIFGYEIPRQQKVCDMQKQMMEIVGNLKHLMTSVPSIGPRAIMQGLSHAAVCLEDLTFEFPELRRYRLTVSGVDVPDDVRIVDTVLPTTFASLAIAGQAKPARERTAREKAAMTLLPMYIEEIYKPIFVVVPRMTARNVTIEPVED